MRGVLAVRPEQNEGKALARAPRNYIVHRHSPDWLSFDLESSRAFLRSLGMNESIVIDFAAIWDRAFAVDYRHFRQRIQDISVASYKAVTDATVLDLQAFEGRRGADDDLAVFVDDDDWLRVDVFEQARRGASPDGACWGSIVVGGEFNPAPGTTDRQVDVRTIAPRLYTNNYATARRAIGRLGLLPLLEHHQAQMTLMEGRFRPAIVRHYLSATNKHPCSTLSARRYLETGEFAADPRRVITARRDALAAATLSRDTQWVAPCIAELIALFDDTLR